MSDSDGSETTGRSPLADCACRSDLGRASDLILLAVQAIDLGSDLVRVIVVIPRMNAQIWFVVTPLAPAISAKALGDMGIQSHEAPWQGLEEGRRCPRGRGHDQHWAVSALSGQ